MLGRQEMHLKDSVCCTKHFRIHFEECFMKMPYLCFNCFKRFKREGGGGVAPLSTPIALSVVLVCLQTSLKQNIYYCASRGLYYIAMRLNSYKWEKIKANISLHTVYVYFKQFSLKFKLPPHSFLNYIVCMLQFSSSMVKPPK